MSRKKPAAFKAEKTDDEVRWQMVKNFDEMFFLDNVADSDVKNLEVKNKEYGGSWKKRGGVGAFMMLARKWDRLEAQVGKNGYDIFKSVQDDCRPEGVIDDIRDLRRYLLLVEAELLAQGVLV